MSPFGIFLIVVAVIGVILICASVRIVRQSTAVVVERLGKYHKTLDTGIHLVIPFIDRCSQPISIKHFESDIEKIENIYNLGYNDSLKMIEKVKKYIGGNRNE